MTDVHRIAGFSYENSGGNPAGVVITDEMLDDKQMLEIASKVNYSETAFLVPKGQKSFRIRYFSPEMEIEFCGHATIASGKLIGEKYGTGEYSLELNNGLVVINIEDVDKVSRTSIQSIKTHTKNVDKNIIDSFIELFNFSKDDLDENYPIKKSFSGNYHLMIFLKDKICLENMEYNFEEAKVLCRKHGIPTISLLWTENDYLFHSRNPFAFGGVYEDPATGSAAIALGEYLRANDIKSSGKIEILQGFDMEVPSKLYVEYGEEPNSSVKVSGESRIIE